MPTILFVQLTKYRMTSENGMTSEKQDSKFGVASSLDAAIAGSNGGSESSTIPIPCHKLNGHNYLQGSKSVMMLICGNGKDYLTGLMTAPQKENPLFKVWKSKNNMVISWLINSMTNEIGENFLLYGIVKEIWDATKIYSSSENISELFSVDSVLQGDSSVIQYVNALQHHWQQHIEMKLYSNTSLRKSMCLNSLWD